MNHWITVFNNLFKSNQKINNLEIVLESDGELSTPPQSHYTPINDKLQTSFLDPVSNPPSNPTKQSTVSTISTTSTASTTSNYKPPCKTVPTYTKTREESPFSKFRIWGQKS